MEKFRGTQKILKSATKRRRNKNNYYFQKRDFFNVKANGPLGIKLVEVGSDEADELLKKLKNILKAIKDLKEYREFEVYRGKNNFYDIIEIQDNSLLASLLPFMVLSP